MVILSNRYRRDGSHRITLSAACRRKLICSCRAVTIWSRIRLPDITKLSVIHYMFAATHAAAHAAMNPNVSKIYTHTILVNIIFFTCVIFINITNIFGFHNHILLFFGEIFVRFKIYK